MANRVVIDIEAKFTDNATSGAKRAKKSIDDLDKSAKKAKDNVDKLGKSKVSPTITANDSKFSKIIDKAQKKADKLGKTRVSAVLGIVDNASRKVESLTGKLKNYAVRTWRSRIAVDDQGAGSTMENIINLGKNIGGKIWRGTVKIADYATRPLRSIYNYLTSIKGLITAIVAGAAANQFVIEPVKLADTIESSRIAFTTSLGSEEKANNFLNQIYKFDEKSPFDTLQIVQFAQRMMNMGWEAQETLADLETIGDWAAAMGKGEEGIDRVTLALGQMRQKGQLSAEEMLQLTEAGVSGWQYLADYLGKTIPEVRKMSEKGEIDINDAITGILTGMKEFEGSATANADRTVSGIIDQVQSLFNTYIKLPWGEGLASGFKTGLSEVRDLLDENKDKFKEWGQTLKGVGEEISTAVADTVKNTIGIIDQVTKSEEFQNASLGGKVKLLWDAVSGDPVSEWWEKSGRAGFEKTAGYIGELLGKGIVSGIKAAISNPEIAAGLAAYGGLKLIGGGSLLGGLGKAGKAATTVTGSALFGKIGGGITSSLVGTAAGVGGTRLITSGLLKGTTMGAGTAAGLGLGAAAGGVAAGATTVSGVYDLYQGYTAKNEYDKKYNYASGATKLGGVGAGAAIGTAILPGVGTLIGAGVGGIAGWLFSDDVADKVAGNADKYAESSEKAAEKTAQLKAEQEKLAAVSLDKHMGKIALSADDLETTITSLFGATKVSKLESLSTAITQTKESYENLKSQGDTLSKDIWLATMSKDAKLAQSEINALKSSVKSYGDSAESYLKDSQYAAEQSIRMLVTNSDEAKKLIDSSGKYYDEQQGKLDKLTSNLTSTVNKALSDGVISVDEEKSIEKIKQQIAEITAQLAEDDYQADINILKAKFGGGALTAESFGELMSGAQESANNLAETYWDAFGQASVGLSEKEVNDLKKGLYEQLSTVQLDVGNLGLDTLREQYATDLGVLGQDFGTMFKDGITPEITSAIQSITSDEETRAAIGQFIDQLAPTTEQIEDLIGKYQELGLEVPEALQEYMNSVDFYSALSEGYDEAISELNSKKINLNPEVGVNPTYNPTPYDNNILVPNENTLNPNVRILPNYSYNPFNFSNLVPKIKDIATTVRINAQYQLANGKGSRSFRGGIYGGGFAEGGYVKGGAQLITVAEEGTPEAIIPLGSHRRERALELFRQVGERIGAPGFSRKGFAAGGIVGGGSSGGSGGGTGNVQVNVGGITLQISGSDGGVLESIRENKEAIAEELAEVFNAAFKGQFANTPAKAATVGAE